MAGFNSEAAMKQIALESLPEHLRNGSNTRVVTEFEYSTGRADIVLLDISRAYWQRRVDKLRLTSPIQNKSHLQSFLQLHGRDPITPEYFFDIGGLGKRKKSNALDWLFAKGYVERQRDGRIRTARRFRRHITTAISVELKLSKWREALKQAKRGSSFTQYQYVAIDEEHAKRALGSIEQFIEANVGLLSLNKDGDCNFYFRPERGSPKSVLHQWRLNERSLDLIA